MPKRITNEEERKFTLSISINAQTLKRLEIMGANSGRSRSQEIEDAVKLSYQYWQLYGPDREDWDLDGIHPCLPEPREEDL